MMQSTAAVPALKTSERREDAGTYEATAVVRHLVHELRQPLSTIESIAYYLEIICPRLDYKAKQQLDKLQQVVQQTNWILSDAVHFLQAAPPCPQVTDLDEIVMESISESARGERLWVYTELSSDQALVSLDPGQARHLVQNVLFFFRQVSRPDPKVKVRTFVTGGEVHLEISSKEAHYEADELQSMFEPFGPHLPAGSGLALASVQRITQVHNGRVEFHSGQIDGLSLLIAFPLVS